MALSERSHPKGIDIREGGRRVPVQLDRLTLSFVPVDADLLPYAKACCERLWEEIFPTESVPGPITLLETIAARLSVSQAHAVKVAIARYSK